MISANLTKAINSLKIQDIYVRELIATCMEDFDPKYSDMKKLTTQTMHIVKQSAVVELDNGTNLLRVFIRLGARWATPVEKEQKDPSVKVLIEAEFVAEYKMTDTLEEDCINEFSLKNASYHVWPYWRELLSNQCLRMQLPKVTLHTKQFAQNSEQETKEVSSDPKQSQQP